MKNICNEHEVCPWVNEIEKEIETNEIILIQLNIILKIYSYATQDGLGRMWEIIQKQL